MRRLANSYLLVYPLPHSHTVRRVAGEEAIGEFEVGGKVGALDGAGDLGQFLGLEAQAFALLGVEVEII